MSAVKPCAARSQRGFGLVEVMVALFILAVGMLGVAGLQMTSKRGNFESVQRTTATYLAQDLLERIRANASNLSTYTNAGQGRIIALSEDDGIPVTDCTEDSCDGATLAMYDLYEFTLGLSGVAESLDDAATGGLTSPTVCITGPAAGPGELEVAIAWRGLGALSNPTLNSCGADSGRYDDDSGNADTLRRVLVLQAYVD